MSAQQIRSKIHRGATVFIKVQVTPEQTKYKPAEVIEVLRGAVRVEQGNRQRVLPFKDIELENPDEAPAAPPPPPPPAPVVRKAEPKPPAVKLVPAVVAAPHAVVKPAAAPSSVLSDFDALIEMSTSVYNELVVHRAQILQTVKGLNAERDAIDIELAACAVEHQQIEARLEALKLLRKGT